MRPTVHVVDDDASTRRALTRLILCLGFDVEAFESGADFLNRSKTDSDGCLLVDVHMPGMNGVELCLQLEALGRRLPTILMTAHKDSGTKMLSAKIKPIVTLYKPFDEEALMKAISSAMQHSAK